MMCAELRVHGSACCIAMGAAQYRSLRRGSETSHDLRRVRRGDRCWLIWFRRCRADYFNAQSCNPRARLAGAQKSFLLLTLQAPRNPQRTGSLGWRNRRGAAAVEQLRALPLRSCLKEQADLRHSPLFRPAPLLRHGDVDCRWAFSSRACGGGNCSGSLDASPRIVGPRPRSRARSADSKEQLFAIFGIDAAEARKLYDPRGDQTLDELKQQVFADRTMMDPQDTWRTC